MNVYFIQTKEWGGLIKIGVSGDIVSRLKTMQTGCPGELRVLGVLPCSSRGLALLLERRLHLDFGFCRRNGEWFHPSPSLKSFIAFLAAGGSLIEALDLIHDPSAERSNNNLKTQVRCYRVFNTMDQQASLAKAAVADALSRVKTVYSMPPDARDLSRNTKRFRKKHRTSVADMWKLKTPPKL